MTDGQFTVTIIFIIEKPMIAIIFVISNVLKRRVQVFFIKSIKSIDDIVEITGILHVIANPTLKGIIPILKQGSS